MSKLTSEELASLIVDAIAFPRLLDESSSASATLLLERELEALKARGAYSGTAHSLSTSELAKRLIGVAVVRGLLVPRHVELATRIAEEEIDVWKQLDGY
ncbi:MAG: hypothetical protein U0228_22095 [Myxococcaceae bacterium]